MYCTSLVMAREERIIHPMPYSVEGKLVVAISSRALFDFEDVAVPAPGRAEVLVKIETSSDFVAVFASAAWVT